MNSENIQSFAIPGTGFNYTGANINTLQSFENTIALGLLDESGSTTGFAKQMEAAVQEIIKSLRHSPRADNLIYRHCHFGTNFREVHGFLPLSQINEAMYDGCYRPGGQTTLYDSARRVILEMLDYGQQQAAQRYTCNGLIYILTDGQDYGSTYGVNNVKEALIQATSSEDLESLVTILIGVNDSPNIQKDLADFAQNAGFTRYVPMKDATEKSLAQLANFVSHSISSQSQALGTGGPSQQINSLTF